MSRLFTLDERLALCADFVRDGVSLADIGTDHAYLPVWLALSGKISHAIAADVRTLPLERGRRNIEKYHVENIVEARVSDGLREISPQEADDIVIAGMGGELIADILAAAPWVKNPAKQLILQPMTKEYVLREYLYTNGFSIRAEKACTHAGKLYSVMSAVYTGKAQTMPLYKLCVGELDPHDGSSDAYIKRVLTRLEKKRVGMARDGGDTAELDEAIDWIKRSAVDV